MKTSNPKMMQMFKPKPAMNSGIFSGGAGGSQKMDPAPKMNAGTAAAKAEAYKIGIKKHL